MRFFEEFENDLMNVNNIKALTKAMLANGIKDISVSGDGVEIETSIMGLMENVPMEKWETIANEKSYAYINSTHNNIRVSCYVNDKEKFCALTGFIFHKEKNNETK